MESDLGIDPPPTIEPQQSLLTQALAQCNKSGVQSLSRDEVLALVDKVSEFSEKDCELLSLYATFKTIRNWLFFIAGFLGLSAIIFAGFLWIISRNEEKKTGKSKEVFVVCFVWVHISPCIGLHTSNFNGFTWIKLR